MNKEPIINTFLDLVQIDSPSGSEDEIRCYVEKRLARLGVISEVDKAGNLFARVDGIGEPLILSSHMDTVEPGCGIKPVISDGVITSNKNTILGADNKVTVAAILETVENMSSNHRSLELVFSVREETNSGISEFDFSKLKAKQGIVADSSSSVGTIIIASPWITDLTIEFIGKSAHSSIPEDGINALIPALHALTDIPIGRVDRFTTCNIGLVKAGSATNSVPESVVLEGELRGFSYDLFTKAQVNMKNICEQNANRYGATLKYDEKPYSVGYKLEKNEKAVRDIHTLFKNLGIKTIYKKSFGGSDANAFIKNGIKVINIGDGSKNAHTKNESIEIKELIRLAEFYKAYVHN